MSASSGFEFPGLETERTVLRILTLDDAEAVRVHFSDPAVTRFMDIEPCESIEEAREIIQFHLDDRGCRWGVFLRSDPEDLIGTCGFHAWYPDQNPQESSLGYDLARSHWGLGFMQEVVREMLLFAFDPGGMNLRRIVVDVEPENERSIRLLERLGFKRVKDRFDEGMAWFVLRRRHDPTGSV
ncbi:MAG: GNAT family N-acetyltransferase [Verrucomicrobiales bacterium]|nr:GNAT family N-acetyltransferase [Verrucomicrobiales bacterium]